MKQLGQKAGFFEQGLLAQAVDDSRSIVLAVNLAERRQDVGPCFDSLLGDATRVQSEKAAKRCTQHHVLIGALGEQPSAHVAADGQRRQSGVERQASQVCCNPGRRQAVHRRGERNLAPAPADRFADPRGDFPARYVGGDQILAAATFAFSQRQRGRKHYRTQVGLGGPAPVVAVRHHRRAAGHERGQFRRGLEL